MNAKLIPFKIFIILSVIVLAGIAIKTVAPAPEEIGYIAYDSPTVEAFVLDKQGALQEAPPLVRGTKVIVTGKDYQTADDSMSGDDEQTLAAVEIGDETYYIDPAFIVESKKDVVLEKQLFVRTPVTIYTKANAPDITGFAPKGSALVIIGHSKVREDGTVAKYRIQYDDMSGYVYSKYLVASEKAAKKNCNEHGVYDMAKKAKYSIDLHGGEATHLDYYPCEFEAIEGNDFCAHARAMYLHAGAAVSEKYFELAKNSGVNAVVINIDGGTLAYKSPVAQELCPSAYKDATYSLEKYQKAVQKYNDAGFYTIGRIVAFNDPHYARDHKEACIVSGGKKTKWVSAYDRGAWEYKVKLAIEAVETMGFHEIQFDYVRFPESSYELSVSGDTDFRNQYNEEKAQVIQNFCYYAKDQIHEVGAYMSIDVFGECSNGYVTAYGQYWPAISNVVDAISSMPYTDHFGDADTWSEPYGCMYDWAKRSAKMQKKIPTPACARTWITGYNTPHWNPTVNYDYSKLHDQITALKDAGLDGGFIPWNSSCDFEKYNQYSKIWNK